MKGKEILDIANSNNGYLYSEILKKHDIESTYITRLIKKGKLFKVAPGIYITENAVEDDYLTIGETVEINNNYKIKWVVIIIISIIYFIFCLIYKIFVLSNQIKY